MRKPLTGLLTLRIHAVKDVDHAASSRFSRGPETFVVVKVEDTVKARTRATRNDRWSEENFNIEIDKANEIELTVYDKAGDRPTPVGMLWIRISDIAEEMRRKKIETEFNASGWVSADKMTQGPGRPDSNPGMSSPSQHPGGPRPGPPGQNAPGAPAGGPVMIESWFSLEPAGRIHLTMSFGKSIQTPLLGSVSVDHRCSQAIEGSTTVRHRSQSTRSCPPEERRGPREARPQVRHAAVLQYYALCSLRRFLEVRCWYAVRRLQVHLPPQVLSQSGHQVYQQGQLRDRSG